MRSGRRGVLIVVGIWLISAVLWLTPGLYRPDGLGYFVYLPSTWLDHDLLFFDEWEQMGLIRGDAIAYKDPTPNGHLGNHWTAGSAIAWYPAYVFGDAVRAMAPLSPRDGMSLAYVTPVVVVSAIAGLLTLLAGWKIAASLFGGRAATGAAIGIWLGSPLAWYSLRHATMSHAMSAAACAAVVLLALRLREEPTVERLFSVGLAVGFAAAVRPQNAAFALVPLLVVEPSTLRRVLRGSGWMAAGGTIGLLPQIAVSMALWGAPFAFANVGGSGNRWQTFERVRLWQTLFSWYHGLAPWTPLLLVAVAGFFVLLRRDRPLARAAIVSFAIQWLLVSLMDRSFWGGSAFGQRRFDNCTLFFIVGLAACLARLPKWGAAAVVAAGSAWTTLLFIASAKLNLNAYHPPAEIAQAALEALSSTAWRTPLGYAPAEIRGIAAVFAVATLLFAACAAFAFLRLRARPAAVAACAAAWLIGAAAFFAWCGTHDAAHLTPRNRSMIAAAREGRVASGEALNTLDALRHELDYLVRTGQTREAAQTFRELETLSESIRRGR